MKTRVTITLDPKVVRKAKSVARFHQTNLSALIETLLVQTTHSATSKPAGFSEKWGGKLSLRESDDKDPLLEAIKSGHRLYR